MGRQAGGWGADGSQEGVECATHMHTRPLLRSAWLEEWEREAEENWLWVVWAGGVGVGRVYRCSRVCVLGQHVNARPLGRAVRAVQGCHLNMALTCSLGLLTPWDAPGGC